MSTTNDRSVLVTGAGRGIGRATAVRLSNHGWLVYAGVRSKDDGERLANESDGRIVPVILDVRSADDIASLHEVLPARLTAVVNNAGIVVDGPVETLAPDQLRDVFEVNVIGAVAVTQAVLGRLRVGQGRVVFISSLSGRVATPWTGAYSASKAALESIADALRIELRAWRIPVSLIEPSATDTDMWASAAEMVDDTARQMSESHRDLYSEHLAGIRRGLGFIQQHTVPADRVVAAVEHAVASRRPKIRYPIGVESRVMLASSAITPTRVQDAVLAKAMGFPEGIRR
jgi:NAD(P)-dependent dehydrogenase (short-subunit alcohol dehydrogenase family)